MSIPRASIRRPVAVTMLCVAVAFLGVISLLRLPVDLLPDVEYPKIVILADYPNASPNEVERFITTRIENAVARIPGKEGMESITRAGQALVVLNFAWGTDMDFATLNVREAIDNVRANLPAGAEAPVVLRTDPRSEPVMSLSVSGAGNLWELKELSETVFRRRLEQIDGVAQASVTGGLEREIVVEPDLTKLQAFGFEPGAVAQAIAAANVQAQSGTVYNGQIRYPVRALGEFTAIEQIGQVPLIQNMSDGRQVRVPVREVATVRSTYRERESIARYNGREAIGLLVFKESAANAVQVDGEVNDIIEQLRQEYPEVTIEVATSQAGFISTALLNLGQQMIMGAFLAFFVLILFLRDVRYPLAMCVAIPFSIVTTFALFDLAGVSLNIMSLGGLALGLGMLVDNSIVVIENLFRHREKGLGAAAAAAVGTEEVQRAITAATLTTIAVFGPIIYVQGVAGELFAALSFAVAFSLLASLVVAVTLLPTMAARWESMDPAAIKNPVARAFVRGGNLFVDSPPFRAFDRLWARIQAAYERALDACLHHRARVVFAALVLLGVTVPFALDLERSVLPQVDEGEFRAAIELPLGTALETTEALATRLESALLADSAVAAVFSRIGKQTAEGGVAEDISGIHTAMLDVRLRPGEKTPPVMERLRPLLEDFPAGSVTLETGRATALGKLLGASEADLSVRVQAEDLDGALTYANQISGPLARLPSLTNVRVGMELGQPEYVIEIRDERATARGISKQQISRALVDYMGGVMATDYVDFDTKVPVWVRLPRSNAQSLETLDRLRVNNVPINQLIDVYPSVAPVEIRRLDQTRIVPVYADVASGGVDEAVLAIREVINAAPAPNAMRVDVGGENEEMQRGFRDLAFAFTLAVLLVYMILAAEFESLIHPLTILLSVPLGVVGAVIGLWIAGAGLNVVSLIGIVVLVGIVDNDAVVKIDFINQMRREGMNVRDAVKAAGHARLRPIVMTSITTMLAVLPMALGFGAGSDLQAPLAIAILAGLASSTFLTVLVIPVVYELVEDARVWIAGQFGMHAVAPGLGPDFGDTATADSTHPATRPEPAAGD